MNSDWYWEPAHLPRLSPSASIGEYRAHLAALEWSLDAPITINSAEDIQSRKHWSENFEPYEHQVRNLITFCRRAPVALIADDVGLGKTISAALILSELMTRNKVRKALVLCPKILLPQWKEELESKFGISAAYGTGQNVDGLLQTQSTDVFITTYDSARSRFSRLEEASFDMLILDEAHKLRNLFGSTAGPPRFAQLVRDALEKRSFKYVLMLTATPIQNRLWDLYSLVDCLTVAKGHRNPFGSEDRFTSRFLADGKTTARRLVSGRRDEFRKILSQYMVRTRRSDCGLEFPSREVRTHRAQAHSGEIELLKIVGSKIEGLNALTQTSVAQALMSSPQALTTQLRNMAGRGSISPAVASSAEQVAPRMEQTGKFRLLTSLLRELAKHQPDFWRVVVFTLRTETQNAIGEALEDMGFEVGFIRGGKARQNERHIRMFRSDPPEVNVLVSSDAGAEGVNLQVCNIVVNYDLPWNPMIVEQRIGRVQRLGSTHQHVIVLNLVLSGSVEEAVVVRLIEKLQAISHTIGDIEGVLEMASGDINGDDGVESFLRQMVVQSLKGRDVARSMENARRSIEKAKQLYEDEKENVEKQLGNLDEMHRTGPRMPKLHVSAPSWTEQQLVRSAFEADGATIVDRGDGTWKIQKPGHGPEIAVFDDRRAPRVSSPGVFGGIPIRVYRAGSRDFERIIGEWAHRSEHAVESLDTDFDSKLTTMSREWTEALGDDVLFEEAECKGQRTIFAGKIMIRSTAAVAHDRYEKLINVVLQPRINGSLTGRSNQGYDFEQFMPTEFDVDWDSEIRSAVEADKDMNEFCRFYLARLEEELQRTGGDAVLNRKAVDTFTPSVSASLVAAEGAACNVCAVNVTYQLDNESFTSELLLIPGTGKRVSEPDLDRCVLSDRDLPEECLVASAISGKKATRHLMARSEESGEWALPDELVRCEKSGQKILPSEIKVSAISGVQASTSLFSRCEVSGDDILTEEGERSSVSGRFARRDLFESSDKDPHRIGLHDELVTCELSGRRLLSDEVLTSVVSGKFADIDLMVRSDVSRQPALPEELVRCDESGIRLLPTEIGVCAVTGKNVDHRLLSKSAISSKQALDSTLVECELSGVRVLPDERQTCQVSGKSVASTLLKRCAATGTLALSDYMVESAISGINILQDEAVCSAQSGRWGAPKESVTCAWSGDCLLRDEVAQCKLTGLLVGRIYLNDDQFLADLSLLLNGVHPKAVADPKLASWINAQPNRTLKKLRNIRTVDGPNAEATAVCGQVKVKLGFSTRIVGLVVAHGTRRRVMGNVVIGSSSRDGWSIERSEEVEAHD